MPATSTEPSSSSSVASSAFSASQSLPSYKPSLVVPLTQAPLSRVGPDPMTHNPFVQSQLYVGLSPSALASTPRSVMFPRGHPAPVLPPAYISFQHPRNPSPTPVSFTPGPQQQPSPHSLVTGLGSRPGTGREIIIQPVLVPTPTSSMFGGQAYPGVGMYPYGPFPGVHPAYGLPLTSQPPTTLSSPVYSADATELDMSQDVNSPEQEGKGVKKNARRRKTPRRRRKRRLSKSLERTLGRSLSPSMLRVGREPNVLAESPWLSPSLAVRANTIVSQMY